VSGSTRELGQRSEKALYTITSNRERDFNKTNDPKKLFGPKEKKEKTTRNCFPFHLPFFFVLPRELQKPIAAAAFFFFLDVFPPFLIRPLASLFLCVTEKERKTKTKKKLEKKKKVLISLSFFFPFQLPFPPPFFRDSNLLASSSSSEGLATVPPEPPVFGGGVGKPSEEEEVEDEEGAAAGFEEEEVEFFGGGGARETESTLSKGPGPGSVS
jgi:hypothetical protein